MSQPQPPSPKLPDIVETADDGDRPSITEVDGTVAKFEMAYAPEKSDRFTFGVPLVSRLPGFAFLGFALLVGLTVLTAYNGSSNSTLYRWVVEGDRHRVFGSGPLAFIILFAAVGNVIKAGLQGVIVTADAIEMRALAAGFPRVKRWTWAQVDRLVIDQDNVMLELWNGTYERLPKVREGQKLADLLARIATARGRAVTRLSHDAKH